MYTSRPTLSRGHVRRSRYLRLSALFSPKLNPLHIGRSFKLHTSYGYGAFSKKPHERRRRSDPECIARSDNPFRYQTQPDKER